MLVFRLACMAVDWGDQIYDSHHQENRKHVRTDTMVAVYGRKINIYTYNDYFVTTNLMNTSVPFRNLNLFS